MKKIVETAFETKSGGTPLVPWLFQQRQEGASLRSIADRLSSLIGIQVSHETIRRWMMEGR